MLKNFNRSDQIIFFIALIGVAVFSYLTANESIFFSKERQVSAPVFGKITDRKNDVRQKKVQEFRWQQTKNQSLVHVGDSLFTGPDSSARIQLKSGGLIEVRPNSMIFFDQSSNQFSFNLEFGKIDGVFRGGKYNLKVAGQNVEIDSTTGGEISFEKSGLGDGVAISSKNGEFSVKTGEGNRVLAGGSALSLSKDGSAQEKAAEALALQEVLARKAEREKTEEEARLMASLKSASFAWVRPQPEQLFEIPLDVNQEPLSLPQVELEWRTNVDPGAVVLEISKDEDFSRVLYKEVTREPRWRTPELDEGQYFVRIRPEQVDGQWNGRTSFLVTKGSSAKLPPPLLTTVDIDYKWPSDKPVVIEWKRVLQSARYKVEISDRIDFSEIVQTYTTREPRVEIPPTSVGQYFFRVRGETSKGMAGAFSQTGTVVVQSDRPRITPIESADILGDSPTAPPPAVDINVAWSSLSEEATYEVEVADNASFVDSSKVTTSKPSTSIKVRKPGAYHTRVRALGPSGLPLSDYSEPKSFNYVYRIPLTTPVPLEPAENFTLFFQREEDVYFRLTWRPVRGTEKYELEIAQDPEFKNIVLKKAVKDNRVGLNSLGADGTLYWRVRSVSDQRVSNWSRARAMKLITARKSSEGRLPARIQKNSGGAE